MDATKRMNFMDTLTAKELLEIDSKVAAQVGSKKLLDAYNKIRRTKKMAKTEIVDRIILSAETAKVVSKLDVLLSSLKKEKEAAAKAKTSKKK